MVIWETPTDWDNEVSNEGLVHENVANTDHNDDSIVKQGYNIATPFLSSSLLLYFPLHENSGTTAYDFSGANEDGTVNGSPSQGISGLLGTTGYSFDGTDDDIFVNSGLYPDLTTNHTICFWLEYSGSATWSPFINKRSSDGNTTEMSVWIGSNNELDYRTENGSVVVSDNSLTDGNLHFYAVSNSSGTVDVYQDGTKIAVGNATISTNQQSAGMHIGEDFKSNFGSGNLYGVWIFNKALSTSEVNQLYDVVSTPGTLITDDKIL